MFIKILETFFVWYITFYLLTIAEKYHNKPYRLNKILTSCYIATFYLFVVLVQEHLSIKDKCICVN